MVRLPVLGLRSVLDPVIFFGAIAVIWEYGVEIFGVREYLLPPLSSVVAVGWENRATIWVHAMITLEEVLYGFFIAMLIGVWTALAIYFWPAAQRTVYPLVAGLQAMPKVALAPLMIVWFGYGISSKVMMTFLFAYFPIVISTLGGLHSTPVHLEEHFRALRATGWSTFWRLRVPTALPNFIDGCKVGMPLAVIGAVVGEFVGSEDGLGNVLLLAQAQLRTDLMFAILIAVTLLAMVLYGVVHVAGKWVWWRSY